MNIKIEISQRELDEMEVTAEQLENGIQTRLGGSIEIDEGDSAHGDSIVYLNNLKVNVTTTEEA